MKPPITSTHNPNISQGVFIMKQQWIIASILLVMSHAAIAAETAGGSHGLSLTISTSSTPEFTSTATGELLTGVETQLTTQTIDVDNDGTVERIIDDKILGNLTLTGTNLASNQHCKVTFTSANSGGTTSFKLVNTSDPTKSIIYSLKGTIGSGVATFSSGFPRNFNYTVDGSTGRNRCDLTITDLTFTSAAKLNTTPDGTYKDTISHIVQIQ